MKKASGSQIKVGAIITYFSIAFNIIAGLIYTPWMINQIGQSDYALYTLSNSIISLFLLDFGLSTATTRFVAKYRVTDDQRAIQIFLSAVYKLYLVIDLVFFFAILLVLINIESIYLNLSAIEIDKLRVILCITGVYSLVSFPCVTFNGILNAYEKFVHLKLADLLQRITSIGFTVIALCMGGGLYWLVIAHVLSGILAITTKFICVNRVVKIKLIKNDWHEYKQIFGFSLWSTIWALAQRLVFNITPTIMGMVITNASAAISVFGIVTTIEGYVYTIATAINGMFLSEITRIVNRDQSDGEITDLAVKVGRYQFAINSLIVLGFCLIGREFLSLWVGEVYNDAYICILLVIIPGVFYNSLQIANSTLIAKNLIKYQAMVQLVMGITNVVLSMVFSSCWGAVGAALSICISYIVRVVLTIILIKLKLNINLLEFLKKCYIKMSIPFVVSFLLSWVIVRQIDAQDWKLLLVKGLLVIVIYVISVVSCGLYPEERKRLFIHDRDNQ